MNAQELAEYIVAWLERRNGGELANALDAQSVGQRRLMISELALFLLHTGKPPNWVGP